MKHPFFNACGISYGNKLAIKEMAAKTDITYQQMSYYDRNGILPFNDHLERILSFLKTDLITFKIRMGIIDFQVKEYLSKMHGSYQEEQTASENRAKINLKTPSFHTEFGKLYQGDCIELLRLLPSNCIDMIFADPPFNLKKFYLSNINDDLLPNEYIRWTEEWMDECIRVLKPGGSFFLWNIPKWNTYFSGFLNTRLTFRHWIATDIKCSLPISGRLYPSHYSILYYVKGDRPNTFKPDRMPMEVCSSCLADLKDYGGYKDKMNPHGVNLTDVWYDIPPVRHKKYKRRSEANELSIKLLDRIIEMSTNEEDIIFDPFGGSGTTYITAELKSRRWIGVELGPLDTIMERFNLLGEEGDLLRKYRSSYNRLFPDAIKHRRKQLHLWTEDSFKASSIS